MRRRATHTRGWTALAMLMMVGALVALTTVGLSARTRDLGFEDRSHMRAQARWAAESGLAQSQNRLPRAKSFQGKLSGNEVCRTVTYRARTTRVGSEVAVEAHGVCHAADDRPVHARILARFVRKRGRWRMIYRNER